MNEDASFPVTGDSPANPGRSSTVDAFFGREREMAALRAGIDDALAGRGRLFLVSGEPGIGKSRLAEEVSREAAQRGMRVLWGRCWEGGGAPAYWPIIQVLRGCAERPDFAQLVEALGSGIAPVASLVPEIVGPVPSHQESPRLDQVDPKQARFRLFDAVARLLRAVASREPIVVIIDDLHDADSAALEMMRFLARSVKDAPVLVIGTHREAEVERSPELRSAMAELARESNQLPLSGLNRLDVADLMRARTGITPEDQFVATLHHTTEGNPLFLSGVLQKLLSEGRLEHQERLKASELRLPANVRGTIKARLEGISSRTMTVLSIAAVLGATFDLAPLERAADTGGQEILLSLDEAAALSIIAPIPDSSTSFRFTHALVRSEVYDGIGIAERARLHRQVGEALEGVYDNDLSPHLSEIANHFRLAISSGTGEKAISYSILAGKTAQGACAYEEAISQFEAALALMDQHHVYTRQRADLLLELGSLLYLSDTRLGIEHLESAVTAYEELKLTDDAARCEARLGTVLASPGQRIDTPRALVHLRKAEKVLGQGPPSPELVNLYLGLGLAASRTNLLREALAGFTRAMEIGHEIGDDDLWVMPASFLALHLVLAGKISESRALLDRLWALLPSLKAPESFHAAVRAGGGCYSLLRDPRSAREWLVRGLDSALPSKYQRDTLNFDIARAYWLSGDTVSMRRHLADWRQFDESLRLAAESFFAGPDGDWERLKLSLQVEPESNYTKVHPFDGRYLEQQWLAGLLRDSGDNRKAEEILLSALESCDGDQPLLHRELVLRPDHALNLVALGNLEHAQAEIQRCADILAQGEDWCGLAGRYHLAAGFCAAAAGDSTQSERHFVAAVETFRRLTLPWYEAETLRLWGQALGTARQSRASDEKFDDTIAIYRRIGAEQALIEVVEQTRAVGAAETAQSHDRSECVIRREGEYWTIAYDGRTTRLKDAKGLHYLAYLLAHPGEEIRALDLAALVSGASVEGTGTTEAEDFAHSDTLARDLGDAGEMLDAQARSAYRRRLTELREELEEAREFGNQHRAERAQAEIEALAGELKRAVGLGGRRRRAASSSERARAAMTQAIRLVLGKIAENNTALGKILSATIKTGTACRYAPDRRFPISFKL